MKTEKNNTIDLTSKMSKAKDSIRYLYPSSNEIHDLPENQSMG